MSISTLIAIYFIIWWVVLFAVLPWGVHSQDEGGGEIQVGTDPGAPTKALMVRKLIWTTVVAGVIFGTFYVLQATNVISLEKVIQFANPPHT